MGVDRRTWLQLVCCLESSGPGFRGEGQRSGERVEVQRYAGPEMAERVGNKGRG